MSNGQKVLSGRRMVPFPGRISDQERHNNNKAYNNIVDEISVKTFLICNPDFLDKFLFEDVETSRLKTVLNRKVELETGKSDPSLCITPRKPIMDSKFKGEDIQEIVTKCLTDFANYTCPFAVLRGAVQTVADVLDADGFTLYVLSHNDKDLEIFEADKTKTPYGPIGYNMTVAAHVAMERKSLLITNLVQDTRFPKGLRLGNDAYSVICIPLVVPLGDLLAIGEIYRDGLKDSFNQKDFQIANAMLAWNLSSLHLTQINRVLETQQEMNDFLLETTKILFDDVITIDTLIQNIMFHTKDLVAAERCALFLINHEKQELFADFFDEGVEQDGKPVFTKKKIRFPYDEGIVSLVAKTGEVVNVPDAQEDDRFSKNADKQLGYTTRNILCMPIIGKNGVIGVVELINSKTYDHFTKTDENAFKMFAVYCALALHYSKLYSMLQTQQDQYKVAMEVLNYHILASDEEIADMIDQPLPTPEQIPPQLHTFEFYGSPYMDLLPKFFLHLIDDLFDVSMFDKNKLVHFILTVRKNYRHVLYHNWKHGFHVAHSLYMMVKSCPGVFTSNEALALVLAGICHDVDHRGFNNAFFQKLHLPLAALYSTSVMEQHHYKQTVMILQSKDHDILSFLSAEEYKHTLERIREFILATDLALYFTNQKVLASYLQEGIFDINEPTMRSQLMNLMMTGADLCAVAKPWETQQETATEIYEEFYCQGDEEKKQGLVPIPMMDRDKKDEIPQQQVGFIKFICVPLYTTLSEMLPETAPLLQGSLFNVSKWEEMAESMNSGKTDDEDEKVGKDAIDENKDAENKDAEIKDADERKDEEKDETEDAEKNEDDVKVIDKDDGEETKDEGEKMNDEEVVKDEKDGEDAEDEVKDDAVAGDEVKDDAIETKDVGDETKDAGDEIKDAGDEVKDAGDEIKDAGDEVKDGDHGMDGGGASDVAKDVGDEIKEVGAGANDGLEERKDAGDEVKEDAGDEIKDVTEETKDATEEKTDVDGEKKEGEEEMKADKNEMQDSVGEANIEEKDTGDEIKDA